jgi:hypothetical protein
MPTAGVLEVLLLLPPPEQAAKPKEIELASASLPTHENKVALRMISPNFEIIYNWCRSYKRS